MDDIITLYTEVIMKVLPAFKKKKVLLAPDT